MRSRWMPPIYFTYLLKHYLKYFLAILFGISFGFAAIDYFQHMQSLRVSWNYKILYIYYMWEQALGLLYPLALVFALIAVKLAFVKQSTMTVLHAFGFSAKTLVKPFLLVATIVYLVFTALNTTDFAYAKDKAQAMLHLRIGEYNVNDIFFKYHDTFVYMKALDPARRVIHGMTLFKVHNYKVLYTVHADEAVFNGKVWEARNAVVKRHIYDKKGNLKRYSVEKAARIETLKGYKPKIIESLYEGDTLNLIDAIRTWQLLREQKVDTVKIRSAFYEKTVTPLFALALIVILFFRLPYHGRMVSMGWLSAVSIGLTFVVWGLLFGLNQLSKNGVLAPEISTLFPIVALAFYAAGVYRYGER